MMIQIVNFRKALRDALNKTNSVAAIYDECTAVWSGFQNFPLIALMQGSKSSGT